jgi:putative ABC transport system permease protein
MSAGQTLKARALMRPYALQYLYRRRLRVHAVQELLGGVGVAIAVALMFATTVANDSVAASATEVVHAVIGPADLQLRAHGGEGFDQRLLTRVEHLPGVRQAAPLLEQTATLRSPHGGTETIDLAGTDVSLLTLDGLAHSLPIAALAPGGIGISTTTAAALGVTRNTRATVTLQLRGHAYALHVAAVLGSEAFGALSQAHVAVMPLARLQRLAGLRGRITRILVQSDPGKRQAVGAELRRLAGGTLAVAPADEDIGLLNQALRPADQASGFFAAISALLGFLFAFNAMLLTVPERRRSIADLRLNGTRRSAIAQMIVFQALCLGAVASALGLLGGYLLSRGVFPQSTGYLAEAFTLGTGSVVGLHALVLSLLGGILATCLASTVPLLDLRSGRALDAIYFDDGEPGNALSARWRVRLAFAASGLLALTSAMFALRPALALAASALLALATVLAVPLVFVGVLVVARMLGARVQRLTTLPVALTSLKATTLRSLALAATGAVALFGSVALGGARDDLLSGIAGFARGYAHDAGVWVTNPRDNQAVVSFRPDRVAQRVAQVPGVAAVQAFQGGFMRLGNRRVWLIARPPGAARSVLDSQITSGEAALASARLASGGWAVVSKQIAEERGWSVGGMMALPTPSGAARLRIAALTSNLAWIPGVIFLSAADYSRYWGTVAPTALGVRLVEGASAVRAQAAIERRLGAGSGLEASTARALESRINSLTSEGLSRLGEISTLLLIAAILAMAAALTSAIWQRRAALAGLRLAGVKPRRLRKILFLETALILSPGCATGALVGLYGQVIIDGYLRHVTGFPVTSMASGWRAFEILVLVALAVSAIVAVPGWLASSVTPALALEE